MAAVLGSVRSVVEGDKLARQAKGSAPTCYDLENVRVLNYRGLQN